MLLVIDGISYDVKCEVRRVAVIRDTDISGKMMDGSYFHDVDGTYYDYEIYFLYPLYDQNKYAAIYETLTQPVDGHTFILPYNNSTVALTAKVETTEDEPVELDSGYRFWRSLRFALTSNGPTKSMSSSEVITRGRAPLPDIAQPAEGATYTYTNGEWVPAQTYADADLIAY